MTARTDGSPPSPVAAGLGASQSRGGIDRHGGLSLRERVLILGRDHRQFTRHRRMKVAGVAKRPGRGRRKGP